VKPVIEKAVAQDMIVLYLLSFLRLHNENLQLPADSVFVILYRSLRIVLFDCRALVLWQHS